MKSFNLRYFIRLFSRYLIFLGGIPLIMALAVFFLTQNTPKTYNSRARVYTGIASGSTIDLDNTKVDLFANNTAYDNLLNLVKARSTIEMVALKLFAQHMSLLTADDQVISKEKYRNLMDEVPEEVKKLVVTGDASATYQNFKVFKERNHYNYIYQLIHLDHPDYSIEKIDDRIKVWRIKSSDFVEIEFESDDPAICQNTLLILCDVFVKLNADIKVNQSDAVVGYFQDELAKSTESLQLAEDELLKFNQTHNIINYYEQTKHIASEKEHFELEYQKVYIDHYGAKAVLGALESKMGAFEAKSLSSKAVLQLRDELADVNFELSMRAMRRMDEPAAAADSTQMVALTQKETELKEQLNNQVGQIFNYDYSKQGLAASNILQDWLATTIQYEGTKAKLRVMDLKRLEFEELYRVFSPLGSTMKRLERKIDIAEKEYLGLLQNLGLAKLRQQNVALKSNLQLTEVPYFPIDPKPSKRKWFILAAAMIGFIMVAFTILALDFLDGNINTPKRAEDLIGLTVSSVFPAVGGSQKKVDFEYLKNHAINAISRNIFIQHFKKTTISSPQVNLFFSTQEGEGKSYICNLLAQKLVELGYRTLHITYDGSTVPIENEWYQKIVYTVDDLLFKIAKLEDFDTYGQVKQYGGFDYVLLEIPAIIKNPFPVKLATVVDQTFLVTRANRSWSEADKNALHLFVEATTGPEPTVILNGVSLDEMETVVGELPKKQSRVIRWIKVLFSAKGTLNNSMAR